METKTIPRVRPTEIPEKIRRLSPRRLCPKQGGEIEKTIRREFP